MTNNFPPSFPEGLDCEAFTFDILKIMQENAVDSFEREHVTQYVYKRPEMFKIGNVESDESLSLYRWTIDNKEDYDMVREIYAHRRGDDKSILLMDEILSILRQNPWIAEINAGVKRSAMYQ